MEISKLKYFYTVAESLHVTKSAEKLHIAQPALTQAIKSLETELGVKLFVKKGRNIALTDYGIYLKNKLAILLPEFDSIETDIEKLKNRKNKTVRINILAASTIVINLITEYQKKNPSVIFDLEQNAVQTNSDITIYTNGLTDFNSKKCVKRCIKEEKIYLAVPNKSKYAELNKIDLSTVKNEKFVLLSGSRAFRTICDKICACEGFIPEILFESDSPSAVQNIISTGTGVAFWPEYSWGKIKNKNVKLLPINNQTYQREIILELNESATLSEYAQDFYEFILSKM